MGSVLSTADGTHSQSLSEDVTRRIVVLGKTGSGKSSLANTLFGKDVCEIDHSPTSGTKKCQAASGTVHGRSIKLIDTPGLFDTECEEEMKAEIVRCITECAPGPHVFIIVLKVDKHTEQEEGIIKKITDYFSDEALTFATVLFTHGDQLPEGMKIEQFVAQSEDLSHLVKRCGDRCNVIDNKYWKNKYNEYRSNEFQVKELLNTMDSIVKANNEAYYTNEMLQKVQDDLDKEQERIKQVSPNLSPLEITEKSKHIVQGKLLLDVSALSKRALLEAFLSGAMKVVREGEPTLGFGVAVTSMAVVAAQRTRAAQNLESDLRTPSDEGVSAEKTAEEHLE